MRIPNAAILQQPLDIFIGKNPHVDIIGAEDFNSYYNQDRIFPEMSLAVINSILGSQGDELVLQERYGPNLSHLWYELPVSRRVARSGEACGER